MVYCAGKLIENLKLFYKSDRVNPNPTYEYSHVEIGTQIVPPRPLDRQFH